jgi:exodeoxyribonuclease VII large subunit
VVALAAAVLRHDPRQELARARQRLAALSARLNRAAERLLHISAASLSALDARLNSLSPLAVLDRGYALVLSPEGALIRSTAQVAPGQLVSTRLADGEFASRVESTTQKPPTPKSRGRKPRS